MPGDEDRVALLTRLSSEIVRVQKQAFGKGPTRARSYFLDDMLIVVMHGGLTTAEKTMVGYGEPDQVRSFRRAFEHDMTAQLTGIVEGATGRRVLSYQSQVMFDPDRVIEIFVFEDEVPAHLRAATADALAAGGSVAETQGDDGPAEGDER